MLNMRHANQEPLTQKTQANTYVFFFQYSENGTPYPTAKDSAPYSSSRISLSLTSFMKLIVFFTRLHLPSAPLKM
jgi:hypothetical protein